MSLSVSRYQPKILTSKQLEISGLTRECDARSYVTDRYQRHLVIDYRRHGGRKTVQVGWSEQEEEEGEDEKEKKEQEEEEEEEWEEEEEEEEEGEQEQEEEEEEEEGEQEQEEEEEGEQ
ncbi:hypothetical protein RRG08_047083 [Elysia crispata]|uniref:Uncharacterized protein n=1 Tax=Elysia crispata TaxID=231223 RepID=A0AAE1DUM9_9GAST|nr:hypothetical protein RRG08_047083 [Elysia crispata]